MTWPTFVDEGRRHPAIAVDGHVTKTGKRRKTRIDRRTTRHPGYAVSQRLRKRIEEGFGWIKTTGGLAKTRHRGLDRVGWMFTLTAAACNLSGCPNSSPRRRHDGRKTATHAHSRRGPATNPNRLTAKPRSSDRTSPIDRKSRVFQQPESDIRPDAVFPGCRAPLTPALSPRGEGESLGGSSIASPLPLAGGAGGGRAGPSLTHKVGLRRP